MRNTISLFFFYLIVISLFAQEKTSSPWDDANFTGLKLRSIGPAFMSGRIADIAIHPQDENTWLVGVGSGGVWKTQNAGVTWKPIFDNESCYSIGCVTIDPNNPHIVWVGTGENVGGRHVSYGDGIYRSTDGGNTWENRGLKNSEHISKIIVHPENSDIIWVASQGPLWSKGGERGLFKSTDGGKSWKQVLGDKEWTGVTDVVIDPRNPDRLYAATWQRHRTVAAYMGGGPKSGLHRSIDGGETWEQLKKGLPKSNMGKIGLAISPQKPDILYAAIELDRRTGGVYRSTDRGANWEKRSSAVSGGTGPHYYQELYASPHQFDRIYLMDVRIQVSDNGGKNFRRLSEQHKHSDNHALAFRASDSDYLLVGSDGGIYESFDLGANWRFMDNLPLTQFYKLALDDAEPFYNVYGGTQDNSTEGGPSRTDNVHGIRNADWKVVLNWDGHQPATEPGNPNIMYGQRQEGTLSRIDLKTGEVVDIQPQADVGEPYERFNWDAPILVSPHSPKRIYFASQRLWRSDNRGDDWTALSADLTRNQNRFELPIMGKQQSWDNPWDVAAMSNYNTISSIAESPQQEDLIYIGTDDGLIQITENGGQSWRKIEVGTLPSVPKTAYVNDIKADLFDANTAYIALDNHKYGDYNPYLLKTTDKGKTWRSIKSNLPERTLVWRLVQDHIQKDLLFVGTEFGIYFSINGGSNWTKLKGGVPTISFRDLAIHRRENDLVGASFGRGFYILDDIAPLRELSDQQMQEEATLFSTRDAWWYFPRSVMGFFGKKGDQGAGYFVADNPPFGAVFTYYLKENLKTEKEMRQEKEKDLVKNGSNIPFPGWDVLEKENQQLSPKIWLTVKNSDGEVVRKLEGKTPKGFHRLAWNLRYPAPNAVRLKKALPPPGGGSPSGMMVAPGTYTVSLSKQVDGVVTELSKPQQFEVKPLHKGSLEGASPADVAAFWKKYDATTRMASAVQLDLSNSLNKLERMQQVALQAAVAPGALDQRLHELRSQLLDLNMQLNGSRARQQAGEKTAQASIGSRLFAVSRGISRSTYGPTTNNKRDLKIASEQLIKAKEQLEKHKVAIAALAKDLMKAGAPWLEGEVLPKE